MSTERFSKQEFELALTQSKPWEYIGFEKGEEVYKIAIQNGSMKRVAILVRSSVKSDGFAAETGNDSIRLWLVNTANNKPLGKKIDAYTTRTPGWDVRMAKKIELLYEKGMNMYNCPKCESGLMLERSGRYGKFYGCSNYPSCKQTMNKLPSVASIAIVTDENDIVAEISQEKKQTQIDMLAEILDEPVIEQVRFDFIPSVYQEAIFYAILSGTGNYVVEAVAGSGKTTTILLGLKHTPINDSVAFVAFTKSIATELKRKAPSHVSVSTLHSLGFANIRSTFGKTKVDNRKVYWIVKDYLKNQSASFKATIKANTSAVVKLVSLCKSTMMQPTNENLEYLATNYNVNTNGDATDIYKMAAIAFEESINQTWRIDFDDMIYFCATGKVSSEKFDWLFVDEAQDLNQAQIQFVLKSIHEKSRVFAIGDRKQSIFGFRGADTNAIDNIIQALNAKTLPLSICYRCPASHIRLAQNLVPQIEASKNAVEGKIDNISERQLVSTVKPSDMVLCRTNAPLVSPCFELIRNGIKAIILGRDIGQGLINLIDKIAKTTNTNMLSDLLYELDEYLYNEFGALIAQHKEGKAQSLDDRVKTIVALSDGCKTITELKQRIKNVFTDDAQGVVFSSIHKAKGKEAERVFILHPELMPHPLALKSNNPEAIQQEMNIKYVALTRSKSELYFVT